MKELLIEIGLEPERVEMFNMSSAMAGKFVETASAMTEKIDAMGPNPLRVQPTSPPALSILERGSRAQGDGGEVDDAAQ